MTRMTETRWNRALLDHVRRSLRKPLFVVALVGSLTGCGLLDVSDPTAIEDGELNDAAGAELLRSATLRALADAMDDGVLWGGMVADEFRYAGNNATGMSALFDRREETRFDQPWLDVADYGLLQDVRQSASLAMPKLRAYVSAPAHLGEMFAVHGYATMRLAESFCPGFPLNDVVDGRPVLGAPVSTSEAFERALVDFDSALVYATDSLRVRYFAQVARGRTLLSLGRFSEAAAAVTGVPAEFVATAEYAEAAEVTNSWLVFGMYGGALTVADHEGGTGIDFASAHDPRVPLEPLGVAPNGLMDAYAMTRYASTESPIILASGIEARLIEVEAALVAGQSTWLPMLNAIRTTCTNAAMCPDPAPAGSGGVANLPPLDDPGTDIARQDLVFRERAFWLFATGHRLADLRRLVRTYGRSPDSVFPVGPYPIGNSYGTATSLPFPGAQETRLNPAVTWCTSR